MNTLRLASAFAGTVGGYLLVVRPLLLRWGATDEEIGEEYPLPKLIPGSTRSATMAVTINAPPSRVWPWLVQMGYGRGGWYSWDHLDNWGGSSADRIHPEWQDTAVGDRLPSMPEEKTWWDVAALQPEKFLGLRATYDLRFKPFEPKGAYPKFYTDSLWGFQLKELEGNRTRVIVSGYWVFRPRWLQVVFSVLFLEPSHWIMQTRQFARLKHLVEGDIATRDLAARQVIGSSVEASSSTQ